MSNFLIVLHSQLLRGNVAEKQPLCDKRNLKEAKKKKMLSRFAFFETFHAIFHAHPAAKKMVTLT